MLRKLTRATLHRSMSTVSDGHGFKGVVFGLWNLVAAPQWTKHQNWEEENNIPVGTLQRLAAKPEGAMRGMLDGLIGTVEGILCTCYPVACRV